MQIVIQGNSPKSSVSEKFEQLIADSNGSGNNWSNNKFLISYYILYNYHDEVSAL